MSITERPPKTAGLVARIREHPLVTFFVLANLLSWVAWLPYILSNDGLGVVDVTFPALLGTTQLVGVLPGAYLGPIGSALLVTALVDGRAGLRAWAGRLLRWRVPLRWYAIALLTVPAALLLTGIAFGGRLPEVPSLTVLALVVPMLVLQLITTGLAEEPGWRDFALARLQQLMSPMRAAFVLGPLWALWHLPLFLTSWGGWPDADWTRPVWFVIFCVAFNIVMSWVFNRTGQSLPLSMLMHVSANTFMTLVWASAFPTIDESLTHPALAVAATLAAVIVIVSTRGRLGLAPRDVGSQS